MPSPFPGMDPYLEDPGLWPDVHHGLISEIQAELNRQLRPKYHVRVEDRVYVSDEDDPGRSAIIPDLRVAEGTGDRRDAGTLSAPPLAVVEPVVLTTLIQEEIHEPRLEVIDRHERRVVTVIEILSPANKVPGSRGRESYQQKRREVLHSPSHFVEIDLLRGGTAIVARERLPTADYYVHASRKAARPKGLVWPIPLPQRLPTIDIPLLPEDADARLDLQGVLAAAYERAAYDLAVDYRAEPIPALSDQHRAWADELLRQRGLR